MLRSVIRGIRFVCRVMARVVIVVGVVGLVLWAVSGWMWISSRWTDGGVMVSQGTLSVGAGGAELILEDSGLAGGVLAGRRPAWKWWTYWKFGEPLATAWNYRRPSGIVKKSAAPTSTVMTAGKPGSWFVQGSMAGPSAGLVVLGLGLRWVGRPRVARGKCSRCGYDLRGLASGRCPECGTVGDGGAGAASVELSALELKKALRKRVAGVLSAMTSEMVRAESERACVRAVEGGMFPVGAMVMVYAPIAGVAEVDLTWLAEELARRGCRICVPRLDGVTKRMSAVAVKNLTTDLVPDTTSKLRGMLMARPDSPELSPGEIDVVVVPGIAFDRTGGRLGRGAGYYDRFLAGLGKGGGGVGGRPRRVAIVFDAQVVERVPVEAHDERVEVIVTPTEVIEVAG